ncbi:MAG: hypothetical protein ABIH26_11050, partial [Candidatus Eisenbacteria bacterium]
LGVALGAAAMMIGEYFDTSVKDVHDAEEIVGAPILGTIPFIEYRFEPKKRRRGYGTGWLVGVVGAALVVALAGFLFYRSRGGEAVEPPEEGRNGTAETAAEDGSPSGEVAP